METAESRAAAVLGRTEAEARAFIAEVLAKLPSPPHGVWVARCLEEFPGLPHTPESVATKMRALGWGAGKAKKPAPAPVKAQPGSERTMQPRPAGKTPRGGSSSVRTPGRVRATFKGKRARRSATAAPPGIGLVEVNPADQGRVRLEDLGKCRHGVPLGYVCAICNRDKFEQLGDVD